MELLVTVSDYSADLATQHVWKALFPAPDSVDGLAYYKHPLLRASGTNPPELTVLRRDWSPLSIRVLGVPLESIESVSDDSWTISDCMLDSPLLQTEDFVAALQARFQQQRLLRNVYQPRSFVALPNVERHAFETRFGDGLSKAILFRGESIPVERFEVKLTDDQWALARSVFQSAAFGGPKGHRLPASSSKKGGAVRLLEQDLMILDTEQHKVAVQLPAGPQRIRGLAGTGKTVLLAMKAANLHLRFPDQQILFTFFTQSLYNTVTKLITRCYVADSGGQEPNWKNLHIRHAWGGRDKEGVYSELCGRMGAPPLALPEAKRMDAVSPLAACARHALSLSPDATYDYVLVDEAQDLPAEFFKLLYQLSRPPHAIYWAYDELQNLSTVKMPDIADQFGRDKENQPLISLDGVYPGGIEKDLVLQKSYRCPKDVLMLAHAIGLGVHAPRGCVQILPDAAAWLAIGYEVQKGDCTVGTSTVIFRPPHNSPNRISEIYAGPQPLISCEVFPTRADELAWVAERVIHDIRVEGLLPEDIVVVTIDALAGKQDLSGIQRRLFEAGVQSVIPGVFGRTAAADFGNEGMVTLASVYRAKGNEAAAVYVVAADAIGRYADEIDARNRAFTAISRTKGWVCISGAGREMEAVRAEVGEITRDIPYLRFTYPDPAKVQNLTAETTRRRVALDAARKSAEALMRVDQDALEEMSDEMRRALIEKLGGQPRVH